MLIIITVIYGFKAKSEQKEIREVEKYILNSVLTRRSHINVNKEEYNWRTFIFLFISFMESNSNQNNTQKEAYRS